ncbi:MAG: hypothetical protein LBE64_08800 [Acinetobacter pittii]|jgi:hypothetical protein|nr:hypothetical protein [Acinetobacter pittii]
MSEEQDISEGSLEAAKSSYLRCMGIVEFHGEGALRWVSE